MVFAAEFGTRLSTGIALQAPGGSFGFEWLVNAGAKRFFPKLTSLDIRTIKRT